MHSLENCYLLIYGNNLFYSTSNWPVIYNNEKDADGDVYTAEAVSHQMRCGMIICLLNWEWCGKNQPHFIWRCCGGIYIMRLRNVLKIQSGYWSYRWILPSCRLMNTWSHCRQPTASYLSNALSWNLNHVLTATTFQMELDVKFQLCSWFHSQVLLKCRSMKILAYWIIQIQWLRLTFSNWPN